MYETLEIARDGGVATLWMNRPDVHNAFNEQLIAELTAACRQLDADDTVRVVVLAGRGKSFSAGADLNWMKRAAAYDEERNREEARAMEAMFRAIDDCPKPVIAAVHGAAIGGGVGLVAACDIAIAAQAAVFATSEVRLGIVPAVIAPFVIRAIGPRAARRYFLTAERFDAAEALRIGLVGRVVPHERLMEEARALAGRIAANPPLAVQALKTGLARTAYGDPREIGGWAIDTIRRLARTDDHLEGVASYLEKRAPVFKGQ